VIFNQRMFRGQKSDELTAEEINLKLPAPPIVDKNYKVEGDLKEK